MTPVVIKIKLVFRNEIKHETVSFKIDSRDIFLYLFTHTVHWHFLHGPLSDVNNSDPGQSVWLLRHARTHTQNTSCWTLWWALVVHTRSCFPKGQSRILDPWGQPFKVALLVFHLFMPTQEKVSKQVLNHNGKNTCKSHQGTTWSVDRSSVDYWGH